jgi:hypothetical protein
MAQKCICRSFPAFGRMENPVDPSPLFVGNERLSTQGYRDNAGPGGSRIGKAVLGRTHQIRYPTMKQSVRLKRASQMGFNPTINAPSL